MSAYDNAPTGAGACRVGLGPSLMKQAPAATIHPHQRRQQEGQLEADSTSGHPRLDVDIRGAGRRRVDLQASKIERYFTGGSMAVGGTSSQGENPQEKKKFEYSPHQRIHLENDAGLDGCPGFRTKALGLR